MKIIALISALFLAASLHAADLTLRWDDTNTVETGYAIERAPAGAPATAFVEINRVGPDVTSYKDSNLPAGTTFQYRVRAFDATRFSPYSNIGVGTTPLPPLNAPGNLNVASAPIVAVVDIRSGEKVTVSTPKARWWTNPRDVYLPLGYSAQVNALK